MSIGNTHKDFPSLKENTHYLDSAASSLTPTCVIEAMDEYYRDYRANIHRGLYASAERASEEYESARKKVADFIGASPEEIIFTAGATASANQLVYALEQTLDFKEGDEIVTTVFEHHAMLVPLQELAKRNKLVLKYVGATKDFALNTDEIDALISDRTRIVAIMGASNVTGSIFDLTNTRINTSINSSILSKNRKIVIRDATAQIGHVPTLVADLGADFIFFSGHKMCGPTGIGVLWGRKDALAELAPGFYGGGMIADVGAFDSRYQTGVERFEAGTPNIAGAIGMGAAVEYLSDVGLENIHTHIRELVTYAQEQMGKLSGVTLYSARPEHNVGTISFTVEGVHPHDVAQILADNGVAVRAGHHCAQPLHEAMGAPATTRASVHLYNTKEDVDALVKSIRIAQSLFTI